MTLLTPSLKNALQLYASSMSICLLLLAIIPQTQAAPLWKYAEKGKITKLEKGIAKGYQLNETNKFGSTALMISAKQQPRGVAPLIEAGADVNIQNQFGHTALMLAASNGRQEEVTLLLGAGAKVDMIDKYGTTALASAANSRTINTNIIQILLDAGADVNSSDKYGDTPLISAAGNQPESVEMLLIAGAEINAQNKDGWTPLMKACALQPSVVKVLLDAGADVHKTGNSGFISMLNRVSNSEVQEEASGENKWNALIIATKLNPSLILPLLEAGANIHFKGPGGRTAEQIGKSNEAKIAFAEFRRH